MKVLGGDVTTAPIRFSKRNPSTAVPISTALALMLMPGTAVSLLPSPVVRMNFDVDTAREIVVCMSMPAVAFIVADDAGRGICSCKG